MRGASIPLIVTVAQAACVGHHFVPPPIGSMQSDPPPGESDVSLALGIDDALTPLVELPAVSARPGPPWRLELTARAALAETASNRRTGIGLVTARGALEEGPIAVGVGLGFTLFTFVVTADVGVRETFGIGASTRLTLGALVYLGVPIDESLGADVNRSLGIESDATRPGPTAGGVLGATFGQPISSSVEIRMALVARAFSDLAGGLELEGVWLVGVGLRTPATEPRSERKRKKREGVIEWQPHPP